MLNHHPDEWTHIEPGEAAGGSAKLWAARPPLCDGHSVPVSGKGEMELVCSLCKDLEVLFG